MAHEKVLKAVVVIAGIVGMTAMAAGTGGVVPKPAAKEETAGKKSVRKRVEARADTVAAVPEVLPQDSSKADVDSLAPQLFSFLVITEPDSAAVFVDDSLAGASPCSLSAVTPGAHVLTLKKVGCYLKRAEVVVDSVLPETLSFVLLKPAFLSVISDPAGAALWIDGTKAGVTPYQNDKIKPGERTLKVELTQYKAVEQTVSVQSGGRDTIRMRLEHTEAYRDSVRTARRAAEKLRTERFIFSVVSAIFCIAALVLVIVEANDG